MRFRPTSLLLAAVLAATGATPALAAPAASPPALVGDPTADADPLIGTRNGGNVFPGAVNPFNVYRGQVQPLNLLDPRTGSDVAQSLYEPARQNDGVRDRRLHGASGTHVINGDPAPIALAGVRAVGGSGFDLRGAPDSLVEAPRSPPHRTRRRRASRCCPSVNAPSSTST